MGHPTGIRQLCPGPVTIGSIACSVHVKDSNRRIRETDSTSPHRLACVREVRDVLRSAELA
jgi:hypothetical protein